MKRDYGNIAAVRDRGGESCPSVFVDEVPGPALSYHELVRAAAEACGAPGAALLLFDDHGVPVVHVAHGFDPTASTSERAPCLQATDAPVLSTEGAGGVSSCFAAPIAVRDGRRIGAICLRGIAMPPTRQQRASLDAMARTTAAAVEAARDAASARRDAERAERALKITRAIQALPGVAASVRGRSSAVEAVLEMLCTTVGWSAAAAWRVDERGWLTGTFAAHAPETLARASADLLRSDERPPQILETLTRTVADCRSRCTGGVVAVPVPIEKSTPLVLELWVPACDSGDAVLLALLDSFARQLAHVLGRAEIQDRLRDSEDRFGDLFAHSLDCVFVHDIDGKLLDVNPAAVRTLGHEHPSDLIGRNLREILSAGSMHDFEGYLRSIVTDGAAAGELRVRTRAGEERVLEYHNTLRLESERQIVLVIARDLTGAPAAVGGTLDAERRYRAQLTAIVREWKSIFDAVPLPMLVVGERLTIRRLNRAAVELLGLPGGNLRNVSAKEPWATVAAMADRGRTGSVEVACVESGRVWDVTVSRLSAGAGHPWVVVLRDVTLSHEMQRSLRHLEAISQLGTLVVAVAHEVRNPLAGISASLDALEACLGADPAQAKFMTRVRRELARLNGVMTDLLEYGRVRPLRLREVTIEDVLDAACIECQPAAARAGVTIRLVPFRSTRASSIDPDRFMQVLQNAIDNAIQHSPVGGEVTVAAREESRATGIWTVITIEDQGPGFPSDALPRLFEPFFTSRPGGTGLGLPLVQKLVREHGGTVDARNSARGGAVLEIALRTA